MNETWDFDASKLAGVAEFLERMRKAGAVECHVGPVDVRWAGPPMPEAARGRGKRALTDDEILMHSA